MGPKNSPFSLYLPGKKKQQKNKNKVRNDASSSNNGRDGGGPGGSRDLIGSTRLNHYYYYYSISILTRVCNSQSLDNIGQRRDGNLFYYKYHRMGKRIDSKKERKNLPMTVRLMRELRDLASRKSTRHRYTDWSAKLMLLTAKMEGSLTRPRKVARFFRISSSNQTPACDSETSRASALQYVATCQQQQEKRKK